MANLKWRKFLEIGVDFIDADHKKLLGIMKDIKSAKSWLITILRREYARTFERKVPKFTDVEKVVVVEEDELEPESRTERLLLRKGIMKLEPKYREPLLLQVIFGHSCAEISDQLSIIAGQMGLATILHYFKPIFLG